ncbi:unnamed protein product, partial [Sphacelaria rigidula]
GNILRVKGPISERWERCFSILLNFLSASIGQAVIEQVAQLPIASSLRDPSSPSETEEFLTAMSSRKATSPGGRTAEVLKPGRNGEASENLYRFHSIAAKTHIVPRQQCGFWRQRSTTDMMFLVCRLEKLDGRATSNQTHAISICRKPAIP